MKIRQLLIATLVVFAVHAGFTRAITYDFLGVSPKVISRLEVSSSVRSLAIGAEASFTATALYTDGTADDITETVNWSSSAPRIADSISDSKKSNRVKGLSTGTTMITAALGDKSGHAFLLVTSSPLLAMNLIPMNPIVPKGSGQNISAIGIFLDGSTLDLTALVAWESAAFHKVKVVKSGIDGGLVTAVHKGASMISATWAGISAQTQILVSDAMLASISFAPCPTLIGKGNAVQITAIGNYSDGTVKDITENVKWDSSQKEVAGVGSVFGGKGMLVGVGDGSASLSASLSGISATLDVSVTTKLSSL